MAGWEELDGYVLDDGAESELLARQTECTLIWVGRDGHPRGVIVNYLFAQRRFWLTATEARPRIAAIRADPRVSLAVSSKGSGIAARRSVSYRGRATVHTDEETRRWFIPLFTQRLRPGDPERAEAFAATLDTPLRVVIEVRPGGRTGFDGAKMWAAATDAAPAAVDPTWGGG